MTATDIVAAYAKGVRHLLFAALAFALIVAPVFAEVNVKASPYNAAGNGVADDTASIQSAINSGDSLIIFPPGIYRITSTVFWGDSQTLRGHGISSENGFRGTLIWYDNWEGVALQCSPSSDEFARNSRIECMRVRGNGQQFNGPTGTTGVRWGWPTAYYTVNHAGWRDVHVEGFGVGFDNYASDNSFLQGGAIFDCDINGRTTSNDWLDVRNVASSGCGTYGWKVNGGGITLSNFVTSNNPCHLRMETGSLATLNNLWFEGTAGGTVACVDMDTNSNLVVNMCNRMMAGGTIPFVKMFYGGLLKYSGCAGSPALFFQNASGSPTIIGEGEPGTRNGSTYTAGGYPP